MKYPGPALFILLLALIRTLENPPAVPQCETPRLIETADGSVLNCLGLGRRLTPREELTLGHRVDINSLTRRELRSLFCARTVSQLMQRREKKGYICLYSPGEISHLVTHRELWILDLTLTCKEGGE
ncbi:hypothetical protein KKF84_19195 [Myxococcota bacterium]|nr:hypothetical protein [Myxococcota bacterium]